MSKQTLTGHPIIDRINKIKPIYSAMLDPETTPIDPKEFLDLTIQGMQGCSDCILSETRTTVVKPDGTTKADIMIILESPGALEDAAQIPLVGPMELKGSRCSSCQKFTNCYSHKLMLNPGDRSRKNKVIECTPKFVDHQVFTDTRYIRSSGAIMDGIILNSWGIQFPRQNWIDTYNKFNSANPIPIDSPWFITNVVGCRSTDFTRTKDQTPEKIPIFKCKKWLIHQWAAVQPKVIICFGRTSLAVLLESLEKAKSVVANDILETKYGTVIFQNHPAYFMREPNLELRGYGYAKIKSTLELALQTAGYL